MTYRNSLFCLALCMSSCLLIPAEATGQTRAQVLAAKLAKTKGTQWWDAMDTGPFLADTITSHGNQVAALKGLAISLGDTQASSVVFDTETLLMVAGFKGQVQRDGTPWSGKHGRTTHFTKDPSRLYFHNKRCLGWHIDGETKDPRSAPAGPLPHAVGRYKGLYRHGNKTVLSYQVASTPILDWPWVETTNGVTAITRSLNIGAVHNDLSMVVSNGAGAQSARINLVGAPARVKLVRSNGGKVVTMEIPSGTPAFKCKLVYSQESEQPIVTTQVQEVIDLTPLTRGGAGIYPETIVVEGITGEKQQPYTVDTIPLPTDNPWHSKIRFGAFDFFDDGRSVACSTWNGDVWVATGIEGDMKSITWKRYASGLFQTLGLKIVDGVIYTQGRDQITRLHDLNHDGEADFYECFNNDVKITTGFHEFSFDLDTDKAGNFYLSKGMPVKNGGRGFDPWTEHNGTIIKVSSDGSTSKPIAWGLRAPGGLGVSPDGVITTGENEGSWVPRCKITWNTPDKFTFNGVVPSEWKGRKFVRTLPDAPTEYAAPLCWIPYFVDNSSGSQMWVPKGANWGKGLDGEMLHFSYGKSSVFHVFHEEVDGQVQGGLSRLPIDLPIAGMRGRFHPKTRDLYVIGFRGWQTSGGTGFQRVRFTGATTPRPIGLEAYENGMLIRFSARLDSKASQDPFRYAISKWKYMWTPQYGSGRFSIDNPDTEAEARAWSTPSKGVHNRVDTVTVGAARLLADGQSVFVYVPKMTTAMQMEIKMDLVDTDGRSFRETIYNTIHKLRSAFELPGIDLSKTESIEAPLVGEQGLLVSFGGTITDTMRTPRLALTSPEKTPPSVFIGGSGFEATWQGYLIIPERDDYTFSIQGSGVVSLQIDGNEVLSGNLPAAASHAVTLNKGTHPIFCSFKSPAKGDSRLRLMWESPQFRLEPVPETSFRFIPDNTYEEWQAIRAGRNVFAQAMCIRCHLPDKRARKLGMPELSYTAPDLEYMTKRLSPSWLDQQVRKPEFQCPTVDARDQDDLSSFLLAEQDRFKQGYKQGYKQGPVRGADQGPTVDGKSLIEDLLLEPWLRPMVTAARFTRDGLQRQLLDPSDHAPDTTFPDIRMTPREAEAISDAAIRLWGRRNKSVPANGDAERGKALYGQRCAMCHSTAPLPKESGSSIMLTALFKADWSAKGCASTNRGKAPDLRLSSTERQQLLALSTADRDAGLRSLGRFAHAEYGARQTKALRCTQCHSGLNKLPDISIAGAKLKTEWMASLFKGTHGKKTRPWLKSKMPAFANRADKLAMGLAAMHGVAYKSKELQQKKNLVPVGQVLTSPLGYSCVLCHAVGSQPALQVFEGQGPNLQLGSKRLRYDYYQTWMHWPQRIAPATIMPRYTKDKVNAVLDAQLEGNAQNQFEAIWQWMKTLEEE